jgi:hypothetical protein
LTEENPVFSGIDGYLLSIPSAAEIAPDVSKLVNRGSVLSYSDAKSIMAQQINNKSMNAWLGQDEDPNSLDTKEGAPTKDDICKTSKVWAPELLNILQATAGNITCKSLYMISLGFKWKDKRGVILLGDAGHFMILFAGLGVNIAFEDAMGLANTIIHVAKDGKKGSLSARVQAFGKDLFVRAERAEPLACEMMWLMFFTDDVRRSHAFGRFDAKKMACDIHAFVYPLSIQSWLLASLELFFGTIFGAKSSELRSRVSRLSII